MTDNGRGIPTGVKMDDKHEPKRSASEIALTELHAGGKFNQNSYKVSGAAWRGRELRERPLQMAASDRAPRRQGAPDRVRQRICANRLLETVDGVEVSPMRVTVPPRSAAPRCTSCPDTEIFQQNSEFHYEILAKRLRELSFLNNGVRIRLKDERDGREDDFSGAGA